MSFFDEAERVLKLQQQQKTPSPFHYQQHRKQPHHGYAPFSSTNKLSRLPTKLHQNPPTHKQLNLQSIFNQVYAEKPTKSMSVFHSRTERFLSNHYNDHPGVGSYDLRSKLSQHAHKPQHQHKANLLRQYHPPSMPLDDLGYIDKQNKEVEKVKRQKIGGPAPGAYQLRKDLIKTQGLQWKPQTHTKKQPQQSISIQPSNEPSATAQKAITSSFKSKVDRFGKGLKIKKSEHPGPGYYNLEEETKLSKSISEGHFNSKAMRFKQPPKDVPGAGHYFNSKNSQSNALRKSISFNSSIHKKSIFYQTNSNPGPGQYEKPIGITHDLQKSLLRKFNNSQFSTAKRTVFTVKDNEQPGPGDYDVKNNSTNPGVLIHQKAKVIILKEELEETPAPFDTAYNNFTISNKVFQATHKLTLTDRKPFDSGSKRFKHYQVTKHTQESEKNMSNQNKITQEFKDFNKKVKKLVMTTIKVKVPFGISASKYVEKQQSQLGPGSYLTQKQ